MRSLRLLLTAIVPLTMPSLLAQSSAVGEFDAHGDVGSPRLAGSTAYEAGKQEYTITGAGVNLWANHDEFQFAWKKLNGDFILRARAEFVGDGVEPHRKLGWHIRASLDPDAPYVDIAAHGDGLLSLQYRRFKGDITRQFVLPVTHADVLQLERRANTYVASGARYGEPLVTSEIGRVDLGDAVYAGLFVCAHNPDVRETARFRDVRFIRPAGPSFIPYQDYLGSNLEILDIESGQLQLVHRSAEPFEAPNWTRDGSALIYNISGNGPNKGRIVRFDLTARTAAPIDAGFATHNNNDHVLSFDGALLGISNQGPETGGRSAVYVLPVAGGTPRQVTKLTPSYFHGWSPDDRWLVYTGGRPETAGGAEVFSIYKIPVAGGDESRLTTGPGLDDGPEFSPDGKFIYFNSTRSGRMQIWRMKPDGSELEQVTSDIYNNWFPHLSPDGKWIAFLSYLPDVPSDAHPYYKHVYLRVMAVENGGPRIVAYVYGGQGTMNVPSWSPDNRRIAFVSNTGL
jgi:hypothetical protein